MSNNTAVKGWLSGGAPLEVVGKLAGAVVGGESADAEVEVKEAGVARGAA